MIDSYINKILLNKVIDCIGLLKGKQIDIETEWTTLDFMYYGLPAFIEHNKKILIKLELCTVRNRNITDIAHKLLERIGMPVLKNGMIKIHSNRQRCYSFDIPNIRQDIIDKSKEKYVMYRNQVTTATITTYTKNEALMYMRTSNRRPVEWHALSEDKTLIDFGFVDTVDIAKQILHQKYSIGDINV